RKVMVARALVKNPLYIFADEPISELDPESRDAVLDLLREYHENGSGIVLATHSKIDVGTKADYYIMRNGEIFFSGDKQKEW
ncbi:MAG: energy-coupling factor ABC transporter ATP-binding protein, partial [Spirochaetes bacterium]